MLVRWSWRASSLVLIFLAGCDPNPNGPSAPAVPPDASGPDTKPGDSPTPKSVPLKRVGAPIGLIVPNLGG